MGHWIGEDYVPTTPKELGPDEMRVVHEYMERERPDIWRRVYPRIYEEPKCGQYYSPKCVARDLYGVALKFEMGYIGRSEQYEFLVGSQLCRYRVPMFWIGKDMAEVIRETVPPFELDWYNMPLPFEAAAFIMPKGTMVHPDPKEGEAMYIGYARFRKEESLISNLVPGRPYGSLNGCITFIANTTDTGCLCHWNLPLNEYPTINLNELDAAVMSGYDSKDHTSGWLWQPDMTDADNHFMGKVAHMIFGAVLLMNHRPDLVTHGRLLRRVEKKDKPPREFWSPHVLGEHYKIRRVYQNKGGTHASPRGHWVRGFYREQPYGPRKDNLRREQWIEPYWRGVSD